MIKNIIFDLSEVIISGYHNIEFVVAKHTNIKAEEFLNRKKETINMFLEAMRGKYTEDEYLDDLMNGMDWKISRDELKEYIRENMNVPVQGTMEIIKKLKNKYNIILLSDHIVEWVDYILKNNAELSEGIFEYILEDANINSEETIFIDDSIDNIINAKKTGITGIVFENANQLEEELRKLNIEI